ncbi:transposase [Nostoc sp.]|uniref:transposase n=1 Tax=Nostoc sp. TaxID=1180 RepID=UPI003FA5C232
MPTKSKTIKQKHLCRYISIEPLIKGIGANVLNLSPYSPDFNPIELWWSQLKSFLRQFSPSTTKMVDTLIATALDLGTSKE